MRLYRVQVMEDHEHWLSIWHSDAPGSADCTVCGVNRVFRNGVPGCLFTREAAEIEAAERRPYQITRVQYVRTVTEPTDESRP